jgi:hypothetical protein
MRVYKYTGTGSNILTRIIRKGARVVLKSRSFDQTTEKGWILTGSTNDMRNQKIAKPNVNIVWENVTESKAKLKRLQSIYWRKLKNYCRSHGVKLPRHQEGTRERLQAVSNIMDFAFDCGWTGEQDKMDDKTLKGVIKKIIKKETKKETKNDKDGSANTDKEKSAKSGGKAKAKPKAGNDNGPKADRKSGEGNKSPSKKPSKKS